MQDVAVLSIIPEPIIVLFFASVLVLALEQNNGVKFPEIMDNPVLCWFGKYSYGLYVIHGILRPALLRWFSPEKFIFACKVPMIGILSQMAVSIALCMVLAYAGWNLYERHFLKLKRYFEYNA